MPAYAKQVFIGVQLIKEWNSLHENLIDFGFLLDFTDFIDFTHSGIEIRPPARFTNRDLQIYDGDVDESIASKYNFTMA